MHELFQFVVHHSFKVEIGDVHDDFEGHEVNDAVINGVLESQ